MDIPDKVTGIDSMIVRVTAGICDFGVASFTELCMVVVLDVFVALEIVLSKPYAEDVWAAVIIDACANMGFGVAPRSSDDALSNANGNT